MSERRCGFCKTEAQMILNDGKLRKYECPNCEAVETIITAGQSWWYCGWEKPTGEKLRAPTSEEMMFEGKFGWQPIKNNTLQTDTP